MIANQPDNQYLSVIRHTYPTIYHPMLENLSVDIESLNNQINTLIMKEISDEITSVFVERT
jgi:hypothetical protein